MPDLIEKKIMVKVKKALTIDKTERFDDKKKSYKENLEKLSPKEDEYNDKVQGITIKKETQTAKPKVFFRKVIKTGNENGTIKVIGDDGQQIFEGRTNQKNTQDFLKKSEKHVEKTNKSREYNANFYNANTGSKVELTENDKKMLISLGKAKVSKK